MDLYLIGNQIIFTLLNYYGILGIYYWYHRFLHCKYSGLLYKYHYLGHHKKLFPIKRIRADSYGENGNGGWFQSGGEIIFGVPVIIMIYVIWMLSTSGYFINFMIVLLGIIISGECYHSSYHLIKHPKSHPESLLIHNLITKQNNFSKLMKLHDIHHAMPKYNYGFIDMSMDKLFNTYSEKIPQYAINILSSQQKYYDSI